MEIKAIVRNLDMKRPDGTQPSRRDKQQSVSIIRYADDFVIIHEDLAVVHRCKEVITGLLADMGLELKPSKTRIAHTLKNHENKKAGFDFLGFNIRQYKVGKYTSGRVNGQLLGFKTLIAPSKESQKKHYQRICEVIDKNKGQSQAVLIAELNPMIRGWCKYFSIGVSQKVFSRLWHLTVWKLMRWGVKRHRNKGRKWVRLKYFRTIGGDTWTFATPREGSNESCGADKALTNSNCPSRQSQGG